jgi:hypothetical protein
MNDNYLDIANNLLEGFRPVSLAEMDDVKLMDRIDSKYILSFKDLPAVVNRLKDYYRVLTIKNTRVFSYRTDYFDTPGLEMFADHHNGKLNRFKIRQREYIESKLKFLEVKFKSNKGRVIKDRIEKEFDDHTSFSRFVNKFTPYNPDILNIIIINRFNRFTLVDNNLQERVTIDFNLSFSDHINKLNLDGLVIIEVKQSKNGRRSIVFNALRENSIRKGSISKYCLGVSMLNRHNKSNNFKQTIHLVNKLSHVEISA